MNPKHIEIVSPREFNELLIQCSTSRLSVNTDLRVSTGLFIKKHWHSKITRFEEFHEFMDEVQQSRILKWSHSHYFIKVGDTDTRVIDEVKFRFSCGLIGRIIESVVFPRIKRVFSYREQKIKEILEK